MVEAAFHRQHQLTYGHADTSATVELVNARLAAYGLVPRPAAEPYRSTSTSMDEALVERRPAWFGGVVRDCRVWDRERLPERALIEGPAIVEEFGATTVVAPGWQGGLDEHGHIVLEREGAS